MGYKIKDENKNKVSFQGYYPDGSIDQNYIDENIDAIIESSINEYLENHENYEDYEYYERQYEGMLNKNAAEDIKLARNGENHLNTLLEMQLSSKNKGETNNLIGERILFLRQLNNQSQKDVYETAGISRSTFMRYENGTIYPKIKTLKKIFDALYVSTATFSYSPKDFEKWKSSLVSSDTENDIFNQMNNLKKQLDKGYYTYRNNGKVHRVPHQFLQILKSLLDVAEKTINTIPHDTK